MLVMFFPPLSWVRTLEGLFLWRRIVGLAIHSQSVLAWLVAVYLRGKLASHLVADAALGIFDVSERREIGE